MRWCHTDLGAVAYRWKKLVREDLRFAELSAPYRFTAQDALMAEKVAKEWKVSTLEGKCLFDQGPNPVSCALRGGVWPSPLIDKLAPVMQRCRIVVGPG
jgi:hypothetical protein